MSDPDMVLPFGGSEVELYARRNNQSYAVSYSNVSPYTVTGVEECIKLAYQATVIAMELEKMDLQQSS